MNTNSIIVNEGAASEMREENNNPIDLNENMILRHDYHGSLQDPTGPSTRQ